MKMPTEVGDEDRLEELEEGSAEGTVDRDGRPVRDNWDRFQILSRPLSALLGAAVVAVIGFYADHIISQSERAETARVDKTESYRLYTELMSRREEAESLLRQEMFKAVLDEFFSTGQDSDLGRAMLKLEMLAMNFGESLSLSPLFVELDRQVEAMADNPDDPFWKVRQDHYRHRLHSLARRVSSWQLSTLGSGGKMFEFEVPFAAAEHSPGFWFPADTAAAELESELEAEPDMSASEQQAFTARYADSLRLVSLGGIERRYDFNIMNADLERRVAFVEIWIQDVVPDEEPGASAGDSFRIKNKPVVMGFELNFYNFPMIDNTRLGGDQRFALVLVGFDSEVINIAGVVFPGSYASQRDRPFITDVLERLRKHGESAWKAAEPDPGELLEMLSQQ